VGVWLIPCAPSAYAGPRRPPSSPSPSSSRAATSTFGPPSPRTRAPASTTEEGSATAGRDGTAAGRPGPTAARRTVAPCPAEGACARRASSDWDCPAEHRLRGRATFTRLRRDGAGPHLHLPPASPSTTCSRPIEDLPLGRRQPGRRRRRRQRQPLPRVEPGPGHPDRRQPRRRQRRRADQRARLPRDPLRDGAPAAVQPLGQRRAPGGPRRRPEPGRRLLRPLRRHPLAGGRRPRHDAAPAASATSLDADRRAWPPATSTATASRRSWYPARATRCRIFDNTGAARWSRAERAGGGRTSPSSSPTSTVGATPRSSSAGARSHPPGPRRTEAGASVTASGRRPSRRDATARARSAASPTSTGDERQPTSSRGRTVYRFPANAGRLTRASPSATARRPSQTRGPGLPRSDARRSGTANDVNTAPSRSERTGSAPSPTSGGRPTACPGAGQPPRRQPEVVVVEQRPPAGLPRGHGRGAHRRVRDLGGGRRRRAERRRLRRRRLPGDRDRLRASEYRRLRPAGPRRPASAPPGRARPRLRPRDRRQRREPTLERTRADPPGHLQRRHRLRRRRSSPAPPTASACASTTAGSGDRRRLRAG
jgi:hypothetical protein